MTSATLTISMIDYTKMQTDLAVSRAETATAQAETLAARLVDPVGVLVKLTAFARDCMTIARFGIANLPPEMIPGWPYETLRRICDTIDALPDCSQDDRDMATDLRGFARDCEGHEIRRRSAPKPTKLTSEEIAAERARLEADPMGQMALQMGAK
jgi:hypothetical protein